MKYYAGIGSRETPPHIFDKMTKLAGELRETNRFILRSGGANGADTAFERGAGEQKEIWLPWQGFNNNNSPLYLPETLERYPVCKRALEIAEYYHPTWDRLKYGAKRMMVRNVFQVFGKMLQFPVDFIVCWTYDGKASGGTGQAMRIARDYNIPIFNLFYEKAEIQLVCTADLIPF